MAKIKPFKAWRPAVRDIAHVASRPYDVLNREEALQEAEGKPYSFLHVIKPEIDLPEEGDPYAPEVYEQGRRCFLGWLREGIFKQDAEPSFYIYRLIMGEHMQTGLVGLAAIDDYFNEVIKKHELTRPDKEEDRKNHVRVGRMHAEPVFFAYRSHGQLDRLILDQTLYPPICNFMAEDGIRHILWRVNDPSTVHQISATFAELPATYVADGHHRTAAAALVGQEMREADPQHSGEEPYNFFMAVHFPDDQLQIIDYNRVVKDLNGHSAEDFLHRLRENFEVEHKGARYKPTRLHEMSLYLDGNWYALAARPGTYNDHDPIGVLDVTILSEKVLSPILGIEDLRRDKRIDFVGGIRGLEELERRVNSGEMRAAFALYPVSMQQLIDIADTGNIMPPKTTWFEPKLRSGLFVHHLDENPMETDD